MTSECGRDVDCVRTRKRAICSLVCVEQCLMHSPWPVHAAGLQFCCSAWVGTLRVLQHVACKVSGRHSLRPPRYKGFAYA